MIGVLYPLYLAINCRIGCLLQTITEIAQIAPSRTYSFHSPVFLMKENYPIDKVCHEKIKVFTNVHSSAITLKLWNEIYFSKKQKIKYMGNWRKMLGY